MKTSNRSLLNEQNSEALCENGRVLNISGLKEIINKSKMRKEQKERISQLVTGLDNNNGTAIIYADKVARPLAVALLDAVPALGVITCTVEDCLSDTGDEVVIYHYSSGFRAVNREYYLFTSKDAEIDYVEEINMSDFR